MRHVAGKWLPKHRALNVMTDLIMPGHFFMPTASLNARIAREERLILLSHFLFSLEIPLQPCPPQEVSEPEGPTG
jgi:hypothetical protein